MVLVLARQHFDLALDLASDVDPALGTVADDLDLFALRSDDLAHQHGEKPGGAACLPAEDLEDAVIGLL